MTCDTLFGHFEAGLIHLFGHFEAGLIHLSVILKQVTCICRPFWSRPHSLRVILFGLCVAGHTLFGHFEAGDTHLLSHFETGHNRYMSHCPAILKQVTNTLGMWPFVQTFCIRYYHYSAIMKQAPLICRPCRLCTCPIVWPLQKQVTHTLCVTHGLANMTQASCICLVRPFCSCHRYSAFAFGRMHGANSSNNCFGQFQLAHAYSVGL